MNRARIEAVEPSLALVSMSSKKAPFTHQSTSIGSRNARINSSSTSILPLIPSPRMDNSSGMPSALPIISPRAACVRTDVVPDTPSTPLERDRLKNASVAPSKASYATPKRPQSTSRSENLNRPKFVVSKPKQGIGSSDGSISPARSRTRPSPSNNKGAGFSITPLRPAAPRNASTTKSPARASRLLSGSSQSGSGGSSRPEVDREPPASAERQKSPEQAQAEDAIPGSPNSATTDYWGVPADLPNIMFTPAPPPRMTAADVQDCDNGSIASYDPSVLTMQTFVIPSILDRASAAASAARTRYFVTAEAESKAALMLQTVAQWLKSSGDTASGRESLSRPAAMSSGVLLDACNGAAPLTGALLAEIVRRPRATAELLARPPFRFIYAVAWAAHRNTGLGQSDPLFSNSPEASVSQSLPSVQQPQSGNGASNSRDEAPDPRKMDKNERVQWLNSLAVLLDSYLRLHGAFASAINGKQVVSGYDSVGARRLLQMIAVAASANPTGVGREVRTSRNDGRSSHNNSSSSSSSSNRISGVKSPLDPDCLVLSPLNPSRQVAGRSFADEAARRANANAELAAQRENEQRQELVALARTKRQEAAEFAAAAAKAAEAGAAMAWEAKEKRLRGEALAAAAAARAAKEEARLQAVIVAARAAAADAAAEAANRVASARRRGDEEAKATTAAAASAAEAASLAEAAAAAAAEEARILAAAEAAEKAAQADAMRRSIKMAKVDEHGSLQAADDTASAEGKVIAASSPNQPTVSPVGSLGPTSSRRDSGEGSSGDSGAAGATSELGHLNVTADFVTPKHGSQLPSETPLSGVTSAFTEMLRETEQARAESKLLLEGLEKERLERSEADKAREAARREVERIASAAAATAAADARAAAQMQQQQHLTMIAHLEEQVWALREERKAFEAEQSLAKEVNHRREGLGATAESQQNATQSKQQDAASAAKALERERRRKEKEAAALERSQRRAERREREALVKAELELRVRLAQEEVRQREVANAQHMKANQEQRAGEEATVAAEPAVKQLEEQSAEASAEAAAEAERVASIAAAAAQFLEAEDEDEWESTPRLAQGVVDQEPPPQRNGSDVGDEPPCNKEKEVNDLVSSSIPKQKPLSPVPKLDLEKATKLSSPPKVPPSPYAKATSPSSEVRASLERGSSRIDGTTSNDSDDSSSSDSDSSVSARAGVTSAMNSPSQEKQEEAARVAEDGYTRPPNMTLELFEYLKALFAAHDANGTGALDWEAFWWCIKGLGLGLSDDDIHAAHKRAGHTAAGEVKWADFVPVAGALLHKSTHPFGDYHRHANNPWVRMFDRESSSHYYFNRKTQACEWVDGTVAQYERVKGYAIWSEPLFKAKDQQRLDKNTLTVSSGSGETDIDAVAAEVGMVQSEVTASDQLLPLDPSWEEHMDPTSGSSYFVNQTTGETTWERPPVPHVAEVGSSPAGPWPLQQQEESSSNGSPSRQPFGSTGSGNSPLGRSHSVSAHEWGNRVEERPSQSLSRAVTAAPQDWQQHHHMYAGPPNGAYYSPQQQQQLPSYGWRQPLPQQPQQPIYGSIPPYGSHGDPTQYAPPAWAQEQPPHDWGQVPLEQAQPPQTQPPRWSPQPAFELARSHTATPDLWHPSLNPPPRGEYLQQQQQHEMPQQQRELVRAYTAAPNDMWGGSPENWAAYQQQPQPQMQSNWGDGGNLWEQQPNNEDQNSSSWQQTETGGDEAARTEPSISGAQDEDLAYEVTDPENLFQDLQSRTQEEDARNNVMMQTPAHESAHASSMRSLSPPRYLDAAALDYGNPENGTWEEQGPSGMSPPRVIPRAAPQGFGSFDPASQGGGGYYDEYGAWVETSGGVVNGSLQAEGTWDWDENQWNSYQETEGAAQTADY